MRPRLANLYVGDIVGHGRRLGQRNSPDNPWTGSGAEGGLTNAHLRCKTQLPIASTSIRVLK